MAGSLAGLVARRLTRSFVGHQAQQALPLRRHHGQTCSGSLPDHMDAHRPPAVSVSTASLCSVGQCSSGPQRLWVVFVFLLFPTRKRNGHSRLPPRCNDYLRAGSTLCLRFHASSSQAGHTMGGKGGDSRPVSALARPRNQSIAPRRSCHEAWGTASLWCCLTG